MAQTNPALRIVEESPAEPSTWTTELEDLLTRAAELSARHGVVGEDFMTIAWQACLDANPELRRELEDKELRTQLKRLRRQGLIGQA